MPINVNDTMYGTVIVSLLRREPKKIFSRIQTGHVYHGHRNWVPCTMDIVIGCHVPWTRHHDLKGFTHQR